MKRTAAQQFLINASRDAAFVMPALKAPAPSSSHADNVSPVHIYKGAYGRCSAVFNKGVDGFYLPTHISVGYGENSNGVYQEMHTESVTLDRAYPERLTFSIESPIYLPQSKPFHGDEIQQLQIMRESAEDMGLLTKMLGWRLPHRPLTFMREDYFSEVPRMLDNADSKFIYSARLAIR